MASGPPNNVKRGFSRVFSRGPVFPSYRRSDGADPAIALVWALRASGVPVWLDRSDLSHGDTERRLGEAMKSGPFCPRAPSVEDCSRHERTAPEPCIDFAKVARSHCLQRIEALRPSIEAAGHVIDTIDLQTRDSYISCGRDQGFVINMGTTRDA